MGGKTEPFYPEHLERVYYSQNREDLILLALFKDIDKGFYVDVGGYDPDEDSVTRLFYDRGWRGINIEPQPARFKKFEQSRQRDINIQSAVSSKKGRTTLRVYKNQGLSTLSDEIKSKYIKSKDNSKAKFKDIEVDVATLKKIFDENNVQEINFLKVDVEGLEYEVLKGNDWSKYRPEVICIEANHEVKDWRPLLIKNNYKKVFSDGLNDYYSDTKGKFREIDYPEDIVINLLGGIRYSDYLHTENLRSDVEEKNMQLQKLKQENNKLKKTVSAQYHLIQEQNRKLKSLKYLKDATVQELKQRVRSKRRKS